MKVRESGLSTPRSRLLNTPSHADSVAAWILRHLDALEIRQVSKASLTARKIATGALQRMVRGTRHRAPRRRDACARGGVPGLSVPLPAGQWPTDGGWRSGQRPEQCGRFFRLDGQAPSPDLQPGCDVDLPRLPKGLRDPMTQSEVEAVLALPDISYAQGLRDRAMLELFYATGIRRMELSALSLARHRP